MQLVCVSELETTVVGVAVSMGKPWVILTYRYGAETENPTVAQLTEALSELYHENLPSMTEGDYAEHGAASLRFGYDDGPMYTLEFSRLREITFEEWADQDYMQELASPRTMHDVEEDHALRPMKLLAEGRIDQLRLQLVVATKPSSLP